jgi:hypothetical protein
MYKITDMIVPLRVSAQAEKVGLDISQQEESYDFEYKHSATNSFNRCSFINARKTPWLQGVFLYL